MKKCGTKQKIKIISIIVLILGIPGYVMMPSVISQEIPAWDINLDGTCDLLDVVQISSIIDETGTPGWIRQDVNKDGKITIMDLMLVSQHFGEFGWIIENGNDKKMETIQKLCINYGSIGDESEQAFIAEHFDIIDCGRSTYDKVKNIKDINPDILFVCYYDAILMQPYYSDWDYVNQYEDWFVHDTNGNRIRMVNYDGPYLMDPKSGWSNYFAKRCKDYIDSHPLCDGIFADDTAYDLHESGYEWNVPYSEFEEGILDDWSASMIAHIQNIQDKIGSLLLIPNAWKFTQFCEISTGVHFWEGFVHGRVHDVTQSGYGEWYTQYAIDTLHQQAEQGKIIFALSGTKNGDDNPKLAHKHMVFTLICFLFAVEDMEKSYYGWNFYDDDSSQGWFPEMDYEFGNPVGEYYQIEGSVYARRFENATVVANISPSQTYTITIGGQSYKMESRTGLIIPQ